MRAYLLLSCTLSTPAACLPRLVTSAELLSGNARRLAVDVLCSANLSGVLALRLFSPTPQKSSPRSTPYLSDSEWAPVAAASAALIASEVCALSAARSLVRLTHSLHHLPV